LGYGWLGDEESAFQRNSVRVTYYGRFNNEGHKLLNFNDALQSEFYEIRWDARTKYAGRFDIQANHSKEILLPGEGFELLGRIDIPFGEYEENKVEMGYQFNEAWRVGGRINAQVGDIYDGSIAEISLNPRFFVSRRIELGGSYRVTHLSFPEQQGRDLTEFTSHLGQLRGQYAFNKKATLNAFIQYSNVNEVVGANIRFRYNFSEGRDFWVVLNNVSYTNRDNVDPGMPMLPALRSGSVLIKYNHTFTF
jgi:hypothetical protein